MEEVQKPVFNKTQFIGSSPPEIFVGKYDYPHIYTGILAPIQSGDTDEFSNPETWFRKRATIQQVLDYRKNLIYSRFKTDIKKVRVESKLHTALNQVAMASKSVNAEFILNRAPSFNPIKENSVPLIGNPAPLKNINIQENPKIEKKVDYLVNDSYIKANQGIKELYQNKIQISNIVKILSAGLLGMKKQRKMVPTKWAITAVDDSISKEMLKKIKLFPEINEFQLFHSEYLGNHYEILLLPDKFSFEVIEMAMKYPGVWHDYEGFFPRKEYASSVTGAYYANRLALSEYLTKIHRQASAIFFREVRPEYTSPLGVGILREVTRSAFQSQPEKYSTLNEALQSIQTRLQLPISQFTDKSIILKERGKQKRLNQWF
ncbi:MAG: hypothetical protein WC781_02495 [Candidatus Pacearchaeota archaeon]|jgi:hypothetical protein